MLRTALQVTAIGLTFFSAVFLLKGSLGLSAQDMVDLSVAGAIAGMANNVDVAESLAKQNADTWVGFALLLLSFGFQMVDLFWPVRSGDEGMRQAGALIGLCVSTIIFLIGLYGNHVMSARNIAAVHNLLNHGDSIQNTK